MKSNTPNKWFLMRIALPAVTFMTMLVGCKNADNDNTSDNQPDQDRVTFVVDSLLRENRKLTDSLAVVNTRLDDCEQARANENTAKPCPCPCKKKTQPTAPKKTQPTAPKKTQPTAPKKTQPAKPTAPAKSTVSATAATSTTSATATTAQPVTQVVIGGNAQNNGAIITGNNNSVNNIVVNGCTRVVTDTLGNVKRTRRVISAHAKSSYTYTK